MGFLVLKAGVDTSEMQLLTETVNLVREKIGPVAAFRKVVVVKRLPKTRSGKVLRRILRCIVDGVEYTVPATIDDPAVLVELAKTLSRK